MTPARKLTAYKLLSGFDRLISKAWLMAHERRGGLINLFFHSLFQDEAELKSGIALPQESITVAQFREIILYYQEHGYEIVSPVQIAEGLNPEKKYLHLTFDDGYYNNIRALPVLKELGGSISVFVSTDHSRLSRCLWNDAFYREARKKGWSQSQIDSRCSALNIKKTELIEKTLEEEFPDISFQPVGELDRFFRPEEMTQLSSTGMFYFENHTRYHAVLSDYSEDQMYAEIYGAQEFLKKVTGRKPVAISYPNGAYFPAAIEAAKRAGLRLGFICEPRKEYAASIQARSMTLGRFVPDGKKPLRPQLESFRSDLMLTDRLRRSWRMMKA
ncbi:MAG: polysaccharide deacetylase family protein [Verrucomicrobiales bacterium]